jgi:WD40 repeat protein
VRSGQGELLSAAFSADGRRFVTAGSDGTAKVWRTADRRQLTVLSGHQGTVYTAAFSPDGQRIVTAGLDATVRVWDAATGKQLTLLSGHQGLVESAAFSPDGARIVSAGRDATARVWSCGLCGSLASVERIARHRVTRQLTAAEKAKYLGS